MFSIFFFQGDQVSDMLDTSMEELPPPSAPAPNGGLDCRLCEPGYLAANNIVLKHNADFYRHLSEAHFVENILEEVLADVSHTVKPFKCNQPGCDFSTMTRSALVPHVGVVHKFAVKYYYQVKQ